MSEWYYKQKIMIPRITENNFKEIFDQYYHPICCFLNLYTKDESIIKDIVQDIFCNLWVNRDMLQIRHVRTYLYTAARNRILNHIRNEELHLKLLAAYSIEDNELHNAYECVDMEEFNARLHTVIDELPVKCRRVFKMSRFENKTYKEIAASENISEKMVEKHISTALRKIKFRMKKYPMILL